MKKVYIDQLKITKAIGQSQQANIYQLNDGSILKLFNPMILYFYKNIGYNLEKKILDAKPLFNIPEIIVPKQIVLDRKNNFNGYTMDKAKGIDFDNYDNTLSLEQKEDLYEYAKIYNKLEDIVKRGHKEQIIFPDLCTCENIFIDDDGNLKLIDYDGLQVKKHISPHMSTSLGDQDQYLIPKYFKNDLFTENLDKKSLIVLYFLDVFNVNLNTVGKINPISKEVVTLDFIFNAIGLDDYDVQNKVWKCFQTNIDNEFLGEDIDNIAEQYKLFAIPIGGNRSIKKLIRK